MNNDNITPLVQLGCPADIAAAICSTLYLISGDDETLQDNIDHLIETIEAIRS